MTRLQPAIASALRLVCVFALALAVTTLAAWVGRSMGSDLLAFLAGGVFGVFFHIVTRSYRQDSSISDMIDYKPIVGIRDLRSHAAFLLFSSIAWSLVSYFDNPSPNFLFGSTMKASFGGAFLAAAVMTIIEIRTLQNGAHTQ